jgi:hypothetical protein
MGILWENHKESIYAPSSEPKSAMREVNCHCEPEALHRMVFRAKGEAISLFGLRSLFRAERGIFEFASASARNG